MKYLESLATLKVFNKKDLDELTKNSYTTNYLLNKYLNENLIKRIKHNYYGFIDLSIGTLYASKYLIGSKTNDFSFVSHHSALEYYGFYNQVYNEVYISSLKRFKEFEYDGYTYKYLHSLNEIEVITINDIRITSLERSIVDSIKDIDNVSNIDELIKSISLIQHIDDNKIITYLDSLNNKLLYKKVGFFLSFFKDTLKLNNNFFNLLKDKSGNVRGYFSNNDKNKLKYNSEWQMYTYSDEFINSIISTEV